MKTSKNIAITRRWCLGILMFMGIGVLVYAQAPTAAWDYQFIEHGTANSVALYNQSQGDYQYATWTFGDGDYKSTLADTVIHEYAWMDYHQVCLSVWNDHGEYSQHCRSIFVGPDSLRCTFTDCVFPGDANSDQEVNYLDITEIAPYLGHGGPLRLNATTDWEGQFSEDWPQSTPAGVNLKHLDCDGNGLIDTADLNVVMKGIEEMPVGTTAGDLIGPTLFLEFEEDTIFLGYGTGGQTKLTATLHFGDANDAFDDLNAVALYIQYEKQYMAANPIVARHLDNCFIGDTNELMMVSHQDYRASGQLDWAFARLDGDGMDGHGPVSEISFIIDDDLIDFFQTPVDTNPVVLEFKIGGIHAVDYKGRTLDVNVEKFPRKVIFVKGITHTRNPDLSHQLHLSPNPFSDRLYLDMSGMLIESISLYNAFGQRVHTSEVFANHYQANLDILPLGMYILQVHTAEGVAVKRVIRH